LIQNSRKKGIFEAFVTMDAGPNVKIITKEKNINTISELLISKGYNVLWSNIDTEGAKIIYESES
jgi:mevalonate pyrophosphate decarboxylase